jgi:hypothetical protein
MGVGGGAAYGDAFFVTVVVLVVVAAMGYVATNVLIGHDFSSFVGYNGLVFPIEEKL